MGLVGTGEVTGVNALRDYWARALSKQPDLKFEVRHIFKGHQMMVITYQNHRGVRAAETLFFDKNGQVTQASAFHADP